MARPQILSHKATEAVQHLQFSFTDPTDGHIHRLTTYTGNLYVNHGAGRDRSREEFEYPVLGIFDPSRGLPPNPAIKPRLGIIPLNDPIVTGGLQFRSAIGSASLASVGIKEDSSHFSVQMRATNRSPGERGGPSRDLISVDVRRISLEGMNSFIFAVVLSLQVDSRESHIQHIAYQVSVLERDNRQLPFPSPILIGPTWNGEYIPDADGHVGDIVADGVPQR